MSVDANEVSRSSRDAAALSRVAMLARLRHYLRDIVYGANDGLITTFAVVAGVMGGALSASTILVVGAANLLADGLSMGVGNYLSIRAHEGVRRVAQLPPEETFPARHGAATFLAFAAAGAVPLLPYVIGLPAVSTTFAATSVLTVLALFGVGAIRGVLTDEPWWSAGMEMGALGVVVAAVAYGAGAVTRRMLG